MRNALAIIFVMLAASVFADDDASVLFTPVLGRDPLVKVDAQGRHKDGDLGMSGGMGFVFEQNNKFYILTANYIWSDFSGTPRLNYFTGIALEPLTVVLVDRDVSVLAFANTNFRYAGLPAKLGSARTLKKDDGVSAYEGLFLGAPVKTNGWVTDPNYVSEKGQAVNGYVGYQIIRHVVHSCPGDGGGPLLNKDGEVIGVNLFASYSGRFERVGRGDSFAVSIDDLHLQDRLK